MYMNKVLICFMSCRKNNRIWKRLLNNNPINNNFNKLIFVGDSTINQPFIFKNNILIVKCEDSYDYLPVKVYLMIQAILKIPRFNNITHILKVDDHDTIIQYNFLNFLNRRITFPDYCGQKIQNYQNGNRLWHMNKCPFNSRWFNKEYEGNFSTWIDGGSGYILSKEAMKLIVSKRLPISTIHENFIYEDLMIALILKNYNIFPRQIAKIIIDKV